ncbi:MAG: redoxin domain-containing protein [Thaumarchaeota archaeon]|nr:redoxin domain-containing protein [Nitrososphaerota archaeon]
MKEGDTAENFELYNQDSNITSLESFRGSKNVVLCFYPKNHLFGCPSKKVHKMATSTISAYPEIISTDTILFAISCDTIKDQKKFVEKFHIPYPHLSDTTKETCKKYAGLNFVGLPKRSTFIIDKNGIIRKIFDDVAVEQHGAEIVSFLKSLVGSSKV